MQNTMVTACDGVPAHAKTLICCHPCIRYCIRLCLYDLRSLPAICLGAKDLLVLPELNALVGVWPQHLAVEADVRDMPGVWVSADHQVPQCHTVT